MPTYDVTLNEINAITYRVEAADPDEALAAAKDGSLRPVVEKQWVDYWGAADPATDVVEVDEATGYPVGPDCAGCGEPLEDGHPIAEAVDGQLYHGGCLQGETL